MQKIFTLPINQPAGLTYGTCTEKAINHSLKGRDALAGHLDGGQIPIGYNWIEHQSDFAPLVAITGSSQGHGAARGQHDVADPIGEGQWA